MAKNQKILAILVGGGPAPGINGVIRSVTIEAVKSGLKVIGIFDGFQWLVEGDCSKVIPLRIDGISRIHYTGGSILRTSRVNPTKNKKDLQKVVESLQKLDVSYLVTIGGDDTAFSAYKVGQILGQSIQIAHVPKTIDNDLPLPNLNSTFGFHTARHYGTEIIQALMEDAKTTPPRWYFVVSMGRKAGHLAIGIGKASGATLSIIGEEFHGKEVHFDMICDILEGAIIKRMATGKFYGVALLAEGLSEKIDVEELKKYGTLEWDPHGNIRFDEIELGNMLKVEVRRRLRARGINMTIVSKNIGYELRCKRPIPFDCEYTQDLGYAAVSYLMSGGSGAIVSIKRGGKSDPLPFEQLIDLQTGKMSIREYDIESDSYKCARNYMIRLEKSDFENPEWLQKLAEAGKMKADEFKKRFEYLVG